MLGFYKLTEKEFEDFKAKKTYAVPTLDPYNLIPSAKAEKEFEKNDLIEIFDYKDLSSFTQECKILKDKKENKIYVIVNFYDYMI